MAVKKSAAKKAAVKKSVTSKKNINKAIDEIKKIETRGRKPGTKNKPKKSIANITPSFHSEIKTKFVNELGAAIHHMNDKQVLILKERIVKIAHFTNQAHSTIPPFELNQIPVTGDDYNDVACMILGAFGKPPILPEDADKVHAYTALFFTPKTDSNG